jgi:kynurenine formamidase
VSERIPRYEDLPITPDAPPASSWGVFGRDDQLGTLNFLTPERRAAAARLVQTGRTINLDMPLHLPARPFFGTRRRPSHTIVTFPTGNGQDDYLDGYYPQYSSQWDGLRHIRHPEHGYYNWTSDEDANRVDGKLGMQNFAEVGIVGRGVLLDVDRHLAKSGDSLAFDKHRLITVDLLEEVARAQGVEFQLGDILLMRTGFATWLKREAEESGLSDEQRPSTEGPGLAQGAQTLSWLWNHQIAAVVSDNLAVEAFPARGADRPIHAWGIALLGLVLGELFDLDALATDCLQDGVYECLFVAKPMWLKGGVGSSANALAIK